VATSTDGGDQWLRTLRAKAASSDKSWGVAFSLSVFLGPFGADRFYLGYGVLGLLKLVTLGGFGLWWLLDVVLLLVNKLRDSEGSILESPFSR
jgi:hypothetical protein